MNSKDRNVEFKYNRLNFEFIDNEERLLTVLRDLSSCINSSSNPIANEFAIKDFKFNPQVNYIAIKYDSRDIGYYRIFSTYEGTFSDNLHLEAGISSVLDPCEVTKKMLNQSSFENFYVRGYDCRKLKHKTTKNVIFSMCHKPSLTQDFDKNGIFEVIDLVKEYN